MTIEDIKDYLSERMHVLNLSFNEEVENNEREKPADYLKVGKIEGGINEIMRLVSFISRMEKKA